MFPTRRTLLLAVLSDVLELLVFAAAILAACYLLCSCASPTFDVAEALTTDDSRQDEGGAGGADSRPDSRAGGEDAPVEGGAEAPADGDSSSSEHGPEDGGEPGADSLTPADDGPPPLGDSAEDVPAEVPVDSDPPDSGGPPDAADSAPPCPSGRWCVNGTLPDGADCAGEGDTVCCSNYCYLGLCAPATTDPRWCGETKGYYCAGATGARCLP